MNFIKWFLFYIILAFHSQAFAEVIFLGNIEKDTVGVIHKRVEFSYFWKQNGTGHGVAKLNGEASKTGTNIHIAPSANELSTEYKIYGNDGKIWLSGYFSSSFSKFNVNHRDTLTVSSPRKLYLPLVNKTNYWKLAITSYKWLSIPKELTGLNSAYVVNSWDINTMGAKSGSYTANIYITTASGQRFDFIVNYNIVDKIEPECKFGAGMNDQIIELPSIKAGETKDYPLPIYLECKDVYQASLFFNMDNTFDNGYKTETLLGSYLQIQDKNNQYIKLDGSIPFYIISPLGMKEYPFTIINNAMSAKKGGTFTKRLTLTIRMN